MKAMKRLFCAGFLLTAAAGLFAQQAVIKDFFGTVEIKRPSSADWEPAARGQNISRDTAISTGFKSTAVVMIGNSTLTVRPLTRLTLAEISSMQNDEKVEMRLNAGRVRADVNAPKGGKTNFTVRSPTATASVRGTVFQFDGVNLTVNEGTVEFRGAESGGSVLVDAHRTSFTDTESGRAAQPQEVAIEDIKPSQPIGMGTAVPQETLNQDQGQEKNIIINIFFTP
jgi:hypothetical protein